MSGSFGDRWVEVLVLAEDDLLGVTSPAASARKLAALALGDIHGDLQGSYVEVGRVTRSSPASYDRAAEDRLWQVAEDLTTTRSPRT